MTLTSGDIVKIDLGAPTGREAGFPRPGVVVTSQRILDAGPSVVQVVPLTTSVRGFGSEVVVTPDRLNLLAKNSSAQCQHIRAVSPRRLGGIEGNVGPLCLAQIRETIGVIIDVPN